jgi:hypothetical protein
MPRIVDLPEIVAGLRGAAAERAARLLYVERVTGRCVVPAGIEDWVRRQMGDVAAVETQTVVRVVNRVTWDGALYNPLRSRRPLRHAAPEAADAEIDLFAEPLRTTTEDPFGRVHGEHCVTSGNISRWDGQCAVLIFAEPDPLRATAEHMRDYFRTALRWACAAHEQDAQARYFLWMWNGGPRGGASMRHAHAQLALGRGMHYARIEAMRCAALEYRAQHGANFFADMCALHDDLGLGFRAAGLRGFLHAAAMRPKDAWIFGESPTLDDALADAFAATLRALIDRTGTGAFDAVVYVPPSFPGASEDWSGFPCFARIVDRGAPSMVSSDIGALDLFAHNSIAVDPYEVREQLGLS